MAGSPCWLGLGLLVVCLLGVSVVAQQTPGCPSRCLCFRTTVRCMFLQLERIPDVPRDTTILDLRFNRIKEIPPGIFRGMSTLNTLLLNNNHIRKIEREAFEGLSELRYLYLYKNQIRTIEPRAFHGLDKLEQLYIHFNDIEDVEAETFSKLPSLERLFLHNNRLQTLPKGIFTNLSTLRRLRLDSNALVCDCQMMWLSEMLRSKRGHTQAAATCEEPLQVQGKSLLSVSLEDFSCRKPEITLEPTDVEVQFGTTAYFNCHAEGDPEPEIVWLHNNQEVTLANGESHFSLLEDGTLMINGTRDTDQGVYECEARNIAGDVRSNAVELKHTSGPARPQMLKTPHDINIVAGDTITLDCIATGSPPPQIFWSRNDIPLLNDPRYQVDTSGPLTIEDVQYTDRGTYKCTASNTQGTVSVTANLEVQVPPSFIQRPAEQTVVLGNAVLFYCRAEGNPLPEITWLKNGRPLPEDDRYFINAASTVLRIGDATNSDRGVYECIAENIAGRREASAELLVRPPVAPTFIRQPVDQRAPVGGSVELECRAAGTPAPSVRWIHNNVAVIPDQRVRLSQEGDLAIYDVTIDDDGVYECQAESAAGNARAYARVTVLDRQTNFIGDPFVDRSVEEALTAVNRAINNTLRDINDPNRRRTPHELFSATRFPTGTALEASRAAEVFERSLEIVYQRVLEGHQFHPEDQEHPYKELISPSQIAMIANLSGCAAHRRVINCQDMCYHHKYRTFDGTCNNLAHPMWGASLTPLHRLLEPQYENGLNTPVGWEPDRYYFGYPKPSARVISLTIASAPEITEDETFTHMLMQWGQFLDHDMDLVPLAASYARFSDGRFCNETCDNQAPCFPVPVPTNDHRIQRHRCIGVTRSSSLCGSGSTSVFFNHVSPREQVNSLTAYIDGSNVYGNSEEEANDLRDYTNGRGLLRHGPETPSGKYLLPFHESGPIDCQIDSNNAHIPCFKAGDHRANEQLGLLSMHTLWFREHNRVAMELLAYNPHWDSDMVYHEARKIVGAQMQHITYKHWLPYILGPIGMERMGEYKGYNPSVQATIINSFATGAFRFGHTLINPVIYRLNETFHPIPQGNLPLHKAFFSPFRIVEEGGIDPVIRGLLYASSKKIQPGEFLNTELTEKLFKLAHEVALDLAALNIQRGRDHGLPPYNDFRGHCGLRKAETFDDLSVEISNSEVRHKLQAVYGHPSNVDLWMGGLSEDPIPGSKLGPTFMCIIAEQFKRLRDGDRFFYENPEVFSPGQLIQIKQASIARLICNNADSIRHVQPDVFLKGHFPQDFASCDSNKIPHLDLKVWTHCCHDCSRSGEFNSITSHLIRRRRSLDYSYPDEKYIKTHVGAQNDVLGPSVHDQHENEISVDSEKEEHSENYDASEEQTDHISHNMMDAIDTRIEGVEEVMVHLRHMVQKLHKKFRRLERRMTLSHHTRSKCVDDHGGERKDKERWKEHDCRMCQCKHGRVECVTETCQIPHCLYPRKIHGQCCPVC